MVSRSLLRLSLRSALSFLLLAGLILPVGVQAQADPASTAPEPVTIAEGFNGPMGILVDPDGNVWVIDSGLGGDEPLAVVNPELGEVVEAGFGNSAQIVMISAEDGTQTVVANLPSFASEGGASGGNRPALVDGVLYATVGEWLSEPDIDPPASMEASDSCYGLHGMTGETSVWPVTLVLSGSGLNAG